MTDGYQGHGLTLRPTQKLMKRSVLRIRNTCRYVHIYNIHTYVYIHIIDLYDRYTQRRRTYTETYTETYEKTNVEDTHYL